MLPHSRMAMKITIAHRKWIQSYATNLASAIYSYTTIFYNTSGPIGFVSDTLNCGCACAGNAGNVIPATTGERSRHASRHVLHARAVMHVGIANQRLSFNSVAGKRSQQSRCKRNPQICSSGKRLKAYVSAISRCFHICCPPSC